jgi:hypothetical protein
MRADRGIIYAKIETSYGVDPSPTVAILATQPTLEPIAETRERSVVIPTYGKLQPNHIGMGLKISFSCEMRGSETATTPPGIGCLLSACNLTETVGASYVDYDLNSTQDGESVAILFYQDSILHKILGCVGNVSGKTSVNDYMMFDFEFTGIYAGPTDSTAPSPTFTDADVPPVLNTAAFTYQTYAACISAFEFNLNNVINRRDCANEATGVERYFISQRSVGGSFDPEVPTLATFNPWTIAENDTAGALTITVGSVAGNRCVVSAPSVVNEHPKYGSREATLTYDLAWTSHPTLTAGNNELKLRFS